MRDWTPLEMLQNTAIGLTHSDWKKEITMNQTAIFNKANEQLAELKKLADSGDNSAKQLFDGYQKCDPAVLGVSLRGFLENASRKTT